MNKKIILIIVIAVSIVGGVGASLYKNKPDPDFLQNMDSREYLLKKKHLSPSEKRDLRRRADLAELAVAVELRLMNRGSYPIAANYNAVDFGKDYIDKKPVDPLNKGEYVYIWRDNRSNPGRYVICALMENKINNKAVYYYDNSLGSGLVEKCPELNDKKPKKIQISPPLTSDKQKQEYIKTIALAAELYYYTNSRYPVSADYKSLDFEYLEDKVTGEEADKVYTWVDNRKYDQSFIICARLDKSDEKGNNIFYVRESGTGMAKQCPNF